MDSDSDSFSMVSTDLNFNGSYDLEGIFKLWVYHFIEMSYSFNGKL